MAALITVDDLLETGGFEAVQNLERDRKALFESALAWAAP